MTKKILSLALAIVFVMLCAVSCTKSSNETTEFNKLDPFADIQKENLDDYITIPDYMGIEVTKEDTSVSDEELMSEIKTLLGISDTYEEVTGRTAELGDYVVFDYEGKPADETLDVDTSSMTASDVSIESLGDASYIPGFQEALVGMEIDEVKEATITFPEEYSINETLSGQDVVFKFTLKAIKVLVVAECTDELVAKNTDYATLEELKAAKKVELEEEKQKTVKDNYVNEIASYLTDNSTVVKTNDALYQPYYNDFVNYYTDLATQSGTDLTTYLESLGATEDQLKSTAEEYAEAMQKQDLIMASIGKKIEIKITQEIYDAKIAYYCTEYNCADEAELITTYPEESVAKQVYYDQVFEYLLENAVIQ